MEHINTIINSNKTIAEKKQNLKTLYNEALKIQEDENRIPFVQEIFKAVRFVDSEKYQKLEEERLRHQEEQRQQQNTEASHT